MDINIAVSGCVPTGEYDEVKINGSGKSEGFIRCKSLSCAGAFWGNSDIECSGIVDISGAFKNNGSLSAAFIDASGGIKNNGDVTADKLDISGSLNVDGNFSSKKFADISGACSVEGNLKACEFKVSGGLKVGGDIEAEKAIVYGGLFCGGLINAEEIHIDIYGSTGSKANSIGGSKITITSKSKPKFLEKVLKIDSSKFTVSDYIEGDEISIEKTIAKTVTGKNITIGDGCKVELVQYSENCNISPNAVIGRCEKI